ncbi:MAG: hypothetical protein B5M54_03150 [Candidatus Aminicenantes bacterium 4484_214]|nr:MAG: hypothetical protein B5M54_03150 [Candidatus Aminicenantes bacterium 4484_214]RLE07992.1 MAG: hypothetical protein DRJ06_05125 [Candidatus Aminicenantes bacterium]
MTTQIYIVLYSLFFLFGFSIFLFSYISIRRLIISHREKRNQNLRQLIESAILKMLTSDYQNDHQLTLKEYVRHPEIFTEVLLEFWQTLSGSSRQQLKNIFSTYLKEKHKKDITSKRTIKRAKAAKAFVLFADEDEAITIMNLLQDKPLVKMAALTALTLNPQPQIMKIIFKSFIQESKIPLRYYFDLFTAMGKTIEPYVKDILHQPLPEEKLSLLVELIGTIPLNFLYPELIRLSLHPSKEIRTKTARALGNLSLPLEEIIETLLLMAEDEAWEVKAQALKSLGKLRVKKAIPLLAQALFSPSWYCRLNGGHALVRLGEEGLEILRKIARQKKDPYAADMAKMILDEIMIMQG